MIAFQNVTKIYPPDRIIMKDINFTVQRGEFILLTGPIGAGKSLLLRLILRQEKPTRGQVMVFGRNVADLKTKEIPFLRRRIGYIPQVLQLMRSRTVLENLTCILHSIGTFGLQAEMQARTLLKSLELEDYEKYHPYDLSRSQQHKLIIARALIIQPAIVLADEPLLYLEKNDADKIKKLLVDLNQQGTIIIWSTQNPDSLSDIRKRVLFLKEAKMTIFEPTESVNKLPLSPISTEKDL